MEDLVAAGDWALSQGDTVSDLDAAARRARRRGAVALREAVQLVRPGAESPRETAVRLVLLRAGLPEPHLNWTLCTADGVFVARLDMAYPDHRVAVDTTGGSTPTQTSSDGMPTAGAPSPGGVDAHPCRGPPPRDADAGHRRTRAPRAPRGRHPLSVQDMPCPPAASGMSWTLKPRRPPGEGIAPGPEPGRSAKHEGPARRQPDGPGNRVRVLTSSGRCRRAGP